MDRKIFFVLGLMMLLIIACSKPQKTTLTLTGEVKEVFDTPEQRECSELGQKIIEECRAVTPNCFKFKEEWDIRGCQSK